MKKIETEQEKLEVLHKLGAELKKRIDKYFKDTGITCSPYRAIIGAKKSTAERLDLSLTDLCEKLEEFGYIKVLTVPGSARWVFSGSCELSPDEMRDHVQMEVMREQSNRQARKASGEF